MKTKKQKSKSLVTIVLVALTIIFTLCSLWQFSSARQIADSVTSYHLHDILGEKQGLKAIDVGKAISTTLVDPSPISECEFFSHTSTSPKWILCPYLTFDGNVVIALGAHQNDSVFLTDIPMKISGWIQPSYAVYGHNELTTENFLHIWQTNLLDGFLVLHKEHTPKGLSAIQKEDLKIATTRYDLQNIAYGIQWLCFAIFTIFLNVRYVRTK